MQHLRLNIHDIGLYGIGIFAFFMLIMLLYLTCKYMDRKIEGYSQSPSRVASCHELVDKSGAIHIEMNDIEPDSWPYQPNSEKQQFTVQPVDSVCFAR
ncbi:hypothetical protein QR680_002647 [Steinernema hermaphroditum]|uniref:Uncharacterized protein n=1 Tax=Steinernema hermaphroditum TaxID=289476 RepID=A0AA39H594_9BILA|nr:hypothetical protein QR680_002647 [Steinernema hermaphroditum]